MEPSAPDSPRAASPAIPAGTTISPVPVPPGHRFARRTGGVLLAVLAGLGLLLGTLSLAGGGGMVGRLLVLASLLYLGYFLWARGVLKVQTKVLTGMAAVRDNERNND